MTKLLEHLEKIAVFSAVAKAGSARGAAAVLRRSQPSVTRSLQVLEDAIGSELFERSVRGMALSRAGRILYEFSERLLPDVEKLSTKLGSRHSEAPDRVVIGCYEDLAAHLWPRLLKQVSAVSPGLAMTLRTNGVSSVLQEELASGAMDFLITVMPRKDRRLASKVLYRESLDFYCAPNRARRILAKNGKVSRAKLALEPLLVVADAVYSPPQTLAMLLEEFRFDLSGCHRLDSFHLALIFALEDLGVAILPRRIAGDAFHNGRLIRCTIEDIPARGFGAHEIVASWRAADSGNPALEIIWNSLSEDP